MITSCPECGAKLKGKRITSHTVSLTDDGMVVDAEPLGEEFWEIECEAGHVLSPGKSRSKEPNCRGREHD